MRFELTWAVSEEEAADLERVAGLTPADLEGLLDLAPDARFQVTAGSVGKGAAGYGAALLIDVERTLTDLASLAAVGEMLRRIIHRVRQKRNGRPTAQDADTLAALGAVSVDAHATGPAAGFRFVGTVPITARVGVGTDNRDIWAACFSCESTGSGLVIFLSPSGTCLGSVSVPAEMYLDRDAWRNRSADELAKWWQGGAAGSSTTNGL